MSTPFRRALTPAAVYRAEQKIFSMAKTSGFPLQCRVSHNACLPDCSESGAKCELEDFAALDEW